jgi:hypothetical protein
LKNRKTSGEVRRKHEKINKVTASQDDDFVASWRGKKGKLFRGLEGDSTWPLADRSRKLGREMWFFRSR